MLEGFDDAEEGGGVGAAEELSFDFIRSISIAHMCFTAFGCLPIRLPRDLKVLYFISHNFQDNETKIQGVDK